MLEELFAGAIADANKRSQLVSTSDLEKRISRQASPIDALKFLTASTNVSVIAEIKRASPSKGRLAEIPRPEELAKTYETYGASAISVLTEERKFLGSLDDLEAVRANVKLPLLRKDFIANEYQVLEARAYGADLVLLIVAGLNQPQLERLHSFIKDLGMTSLVETHNKDEVLRATDLGAQLVGINARDLTTFTTDRNLFGELAGVLPNGVVSVAESAVRDASDVAAYAAQGADCVLVGEALVTGETEQLLRSLSSVSKIRI